MTKLTRVATVAALTLTTTVGAATVAHAGDTECRGDIGAVTVDGNLIVPDDAVCHLMNTSIRGAIVVKSRSQLHADHVTASGGLQGESPNTVVLDDSTLRNGVSISKAETTPGKPTGRIQLSNNHITGDIAVADNRVEIWIEHNPLITGSIQANKNTAGVDITGNDIDNGLQCQDNVPAPTGGGNTAKQAQGQCANLATITP